VYALIFILKIYCYVTVYKSYDFKDVKVQTLEIQIYCSYQSCFYFHGFVLYYYDYNYKYKLKLHWAAFIKLTHITILILSK